MNVNSFITKDYRKKDDFAVPKNKANSNPISEKPKMNATIFATKDYENKTAFRLEQNKPNSKPISVSRARYTIKHLLYPAFGTKNILLPDKVFAKNNRKQSGNGF